MDWRSSLTPQSRQDVVQKLIEVVKLAAPSQDQTKLSELAASTEQAIFEKARTKQEYILLLQQKISNLQAKIAVIQKNQTSFGSPGLASNYINPVIAPKYPTGRMGIVPQKGQVSGNVPVNLRNMVLNLQQQQAQNIKNSIKNQQTAQQALQAAKIAQQTLFGIQMQSLGTGISASSPPSQMHASLQSPTPIQVNSPTVQAGSASTVQSSPSPGQPLSLPSLNLNEAQKADVTEKLKKILPIYQKIDLIVNYLSASEVTAKTSIQKLLQLKNLLTEQFKNLNKKIFLSPDSLDNIYDFLVKMLQAAEEVRTSKISTPGQSIQTPTTHQKPEHISDAFKYAMEQELYLKKSSKSNPATLKSPLMAGNFNWTSELKMYGIDSKPVVPDKSCFDSILEDYEYLFGAFKTTKQEQTGDVFGEISLETEISQLESLGFKITKLPDYKKSQVFLIQNIQGNWTIVVHIQNSVIKEWQLLGSHVSSLVKNSLDKNLLEGKSLEMIQFLQFS